MSFKQQVLHYDNVSDFPPRGIDGVIYVADNELYGKSYYWDGSGYKKLLGDVLDFPYNHEFYPGLDTIGKVIDYLLNPEIAVAFSVSPATIFSTGTHELTFTWHTNKPKDDLVSVIITGPGYNSGELIETMVGTSGTLLAEIYLNGDTDFSVTVEDSTGDTVTETITVSKGFDDLIVNVVVSPEEWVEDSDPVDVTVTWSVNTLKENLDELTLDGSDVLGATTNVGASSCGGSTVFYNQTFTEDEIYSVFAKINSTIFTTGTAVLNFIALDTVTINVEDEEGDPVESAIITMDLLSTQHYTDGTGSVEIGGLSPGLHTAHISKAGYINVDKEFTMPDDLVVDVVLPRDTTLYAMSLTVKDQLEALLDGVSVVATHSETGDVYLGTTSSGIVNLDVPAGTYSIEVSKDYFQTQSFDVTIIEGGYSGIVYLELDAEISDLVMTPPVIQPETEVTVDYYFYPDGYEGDTIVRWLLDGDEVQVRIKGTPDYNKYTLPVGSGNLDLQVVVEAYDTLGNNNPAKMTKNLTREVTFENPVYLGFSDDHEALEFSLTHEHTSIIDLDVADTITLPWADKKDELGVTGSKFIWVLLPDINPNFPDYNEFYETGYPGNIRDIVDSFHVNTVPTMPGYKLYKYIGMDNGPLGWEGVNPINMNFEIN